MRHTREHCSNKGSQRPIFKLSTRNGMEVNWGQCRTSKRRYLWLLERGYILTTPSKSQQISVIASAIGVEASERNTIPQCTNWKAYLREDTAVVSIAIFRCLLPEWPA